MLNALTHPGQMFKDHMQRCKMSQGYPVTEVPFVPDSLKLAVDWKFLKCKDGHRKLGFALAPEGYELVRPECLGMIQAVLLRRFINYPEFSKNLEKPLPRNTIAISISEYNFQLGESCQEFSLVGKFNAPDGSSFSYQKLSENIQVTYYNENGNQFLAGLYYYPALNHEVLYIKNEDALINLAHMSAEPYPLQDRNKSHNKLVNRCYGRYCSLSGKRVVVDLRVRAKKVPTRHLEYNHFLETYVSVFCKECFKDGISYKWVEPSKKETSTSSESPEEESRCPSTPADYLLEDFEKIKLVN